MSQADLKITATADITPATKQVEKLTAELVDLGESAKVAAVGMEKISPASSKLTTGLAKTAMAAAKTDSALDKIKSSTNTAGQSLQNLGRIAQDAPFGFIGIQNNLTPLVESFGRLKAETGSTGSALKALAGSLGGAGGIGLAISVVTGILTLFAQGMFDSKESAEQLGNQIQALGVDFEVAKRQTDAFNKSIDALKGLRDINLKLNIPDDKRRIEVQLGFDRQDAETKLRELQDLERKSEEKRSRTFDLLLSKGSQAVNDLVGQYTLLSEVKKNGINLSENDNQLLDEAIKAENEKDDIIHDQEVARIGIRKLDAQAKSDLDDLNKKEEERLAKLRKQREIKLKPFKLTRFKQEDIDKLFFDESTISFKVPEFVEKAFIKSLREMPIEQTLSGILSENQLTEVTAKAELAGLGITKGIQDGIEVGVDGLRFPQLTALLKDAKDKLAAFNESAGAIARDTAANIFTSIGESLGSGENLFTGFLNALGNGLKALGAYMISMSAIIKGIKVAIKSLNPALLLVGGVALVAIGTALSNAKIPGFAEGVTNFGGGLAMVGERGPELVRLPKGSDVIPNNQLGSIGNGGAFIASCVLRGSDMLVLINRAQQTRGRNG